MFLGFGVFTIKDIASGNFICEYAGEHVSKGERRLDTSHAANFIYFIGKNEW